MALVLDTSVVIDLLRGNEASAALLETGREPLMVSAVTAHEVLAGMRTGEEKMTETMPRASLLSHSLPARRT